MTQADMEALSTELETARPRLEEQTANCPDLDMTAEDSIAAMREFAENEAPGTVAYFVWLEQVIGSVGEGAGEASGDCETDLAALEAYVAQGGTMNDLPMGELATVGALMTAVSTECPAERFQEWVAQEDVAAWMAGGCRFDLGGDHSDTKRSIAFPSWFVDRFVTLPPRRIEWGEVAMSTSPH